MLVPAPDTDRLKDELSSKPDNINYMIVLHAKDLEGVIAAASSMMAKLPFDHCGFVLDGRNYP